MPEFLEPYIPICEIYINEYCLKDETDIFIKAALLHEAGHFVVQDLLPYSLRELKAQEWAVERAEELGMFAIKRELVRILHNWQFIKWNSPYRIHRMAYKLALKDKKWKEYGLI